MKPVLFLAAVFLAPALPAAAMTSDVCVQQIKDAVQSTLHSGPFEMTSVMNTVLGTHHIVAQIVPAVGIHSRTEIADGDGINEFILVGDRYWQGYGDGYTELTTAPGDFARAVSSALLSDLDSMVRARCLGIVEIEGSSYIAYSFVAEMPDITSETTLYVDPDTDLPARATGRMVIAGDVSTTVTTYRYDSSITVSPPAL